MSKGTGIFVFKTKRIKGTPTTSKVELKASEVKAYVMKVHGWDSATYKKQYDILRNKLRSYEAFERASGKEVETQSVRNLLYREARAIIREGDEYSPSLKMQRIRKFTSVSSGKALQKALKNKTYIERRSNLYSDTTYQQFSGLIDNNKMAQEIYENVTDPVQREKALTDYANKLHEHINQSEKEAKAQAVASDIPFGETFGSDDTYEFDYSSYKS